MAMSFSADDLPSQLPSGHHGLPRRFVTRNQRERIIAAMVRAVASKGYAQATVADIIAIARVSRRTFYEHFRDKEECFLAAYSVVAERLTGTVGRAYRPPGEWTERVRAGLAALVQFMIEEPDSARLCVVEVVAAGPAARRRRDHAMQGVARVLLHEGQAQAPAGLEIPPLAAELVIGGLYEIVYARLIQGKPEALVGELPQMLYCVLVPFCGHRHANAALKRVASHRPGRPWGRRIASRPADA